MNETTTRYERLQAAPSDDDLVLMWSLWMVICTVVAISIALVLISVLLDSTTRSNPFNLFLLFLMVPDFLFSGLCAITCLLNASAGHYWSGAMCQFQAFYVIFGIAANNWLNLAVAWELHSLLLTTRSCRRYKLPPRRKIVFTALSIYAYSCFLASWELWAHTVDNFPHRPLAVSGMACVPLEYSRQSSFFFWLAYFPLMTGIPLFLTLGMGFHIWYDNLMPPTGRRRTLVIFFGRIITVFVVMWMPFFALGLSGTGNPWVVFGGGAFGHLQGAVSSIITLTKPDIRHAFSRFIRCCCCCRKDVSSQTSSSGFSILPMSTGGRKVSRNDNNNKSDGPQDSIEPSQNERDRSENTRNEADIKESWAADESDEEKACWPSG